LATQSVSLAKTTRPSLTGVIPRDRLFRRLDAALGSSAVWVTGPPGCGKTTLATSYLEHCKTASLWYQFDEGDADVASFFYYLGLTAAEPGKRRSGTLPQLAPEHHAGLPAFTRRYFQALYQRLGPSFTIVFDGYHDVPAQSALHEVMRIALGEVPPGGAVVIISRSDPPPAMARLRANRAMEVIGWRELRLTQEESNALVAQRGRSLAPEALVELYERTQGWAAGLILMLEQPPAYDALAATPDLANLGLVFDYLAGEIFQKSDARTRDMLLATAYLPQMTASMAQQVAGTEGADALLAALHHNNYFVALKQAQPQPVYQCHPLFREFLRARVNESYDKERRARLMRVSAGLLVAEGQLAEAVALLREADEWQGVVSIIEAHAPAMLDRGMAETLAQWVDALPKEVQQQNPWTLYWLAASRVWISPREARLLYERAYGLFQARREPDYKGLLLACSGAMDAILYELDDFSLLDRWIADTTRLLGDRPELLAGALEARVASSLFVSMSVRQPHHADIERWVERAYVTSLAQKDPDLRIHVETRVALSIAWAGHYPKAWQVIQGMHALVKEREVSPFQLGMLKLTEAVYHMLTADGEACLKAAREGLEIERAAGVRLQTHQLLAYGAGGALASGNLEEAEKLLEQSATLPGTRPRFDACLHHLFSTWHAMLKRDGVRASQQQRLALTAAIELGSPHFEALCRMASAHVLFESGETRSALAHFQQVYDIARRIRNHLLEFTGLMLYSYVALESGRRPRSGLRGLKLALETGKPRNYVAFLLWRPDMLARLCSHALEAGIEREFVAAIIRSRGLALDASQLGLADWPWPFRVQTFGQFRLLRSGEPLTFSGKAQRRPLDLLRVLIAYGGREVGEERITEALWPRIDGDSAHRSFTTTLHRLRKLLGEDRALHLSEGKLTLDGRYAWTDVWAFEQVTARMEQTLRRPRESIEGDKLEQQCERMIQLYAGPFLGNEPDEPWSLPMRERQRQRFVRATVEACRYWQQAGQPERAVALLERALEVDGVAENLYRHLMLGYAQLGRQSDAAEAYNRCRKALAAALKVEPSAETRALYEKILQPS
jgi:ATP/maltotriose-dependent transcriptional regulator MalT/DNA-binding SARP family transcriptional activator